MATRNPQSLDGRLLIFVTETPTTELDYVVEIHNLTRSLGYLQPRGISKQLDRNWKHKLFKGQDYFEVSDPEVLKAYCETYNALLPSKRKREVSTKPLTFFTVQGIRTLLNLTSREEKHLLQRKLVELDARFEQIDETPQKPPAPKAKPAPEVKPEPVKTTASNPHAYEILKELLDRLIVLDDLGLRTLAIYTAETGLGRPLPKELRYQLLQRPLQANPTTTLKPLQAELPRKKEYFSLTEIGRAAGNYAARTAGYAANRVAERHGWTGDQIRKTRMTFNQLETRPDPQTGRQIDLTRYNRWFAHLVIKELQENQELYPETPTTGPVIAGPTVGGFEF